MGSFGVFGRKGGGGAPGGGGLLGIISERDELKDALGYECGWKSKGAGIDLALSHLMSGGVTLIKVFVSRQIVGTVWPEVEMARTRNRGQR